MKIAIGSLELTAEYKGMYGTYIIISKDGVKLDQVDSKELIEAIKALENTCWRPQ